MIDRIFAAPKCLDDEEKGLTFALEHNLGYEIDVFSSPERLVQKDAYLSEHKERYQSIPGWLSLEAPVADLNPLSPDPEIALCSLHRYTQVIDACKQLGGKYIIFPSSYTPIQRTSGAYNHWVAQNADFWRRLVEEQLRATDIMVLIANRMEEDPSLLQDLITRIGSTRVKICLDTGYVNLFSTKPAIDWLDAMGPDVEYVRVSNNDGRIYSQSAFEQGTIDMNGFINHMALLPQRLHLAINVRSSEDLQASYEILKPYLQMQQEQMTTKSLII